jgi:hypothetical protein
VNSEQQTIDIYEDVDVTQTLEALDEAYSILKSWPNGKSTSVFFSLSQKKNHLSNLLVSSSANRIDPFQK